MQGNGTLWPSVENCLHLLELAVVELFVETAAGEEFVVCALLHYVSVLHDKDEGGVPCGRETVSHDEARATLHEGIEGLLNEDFSASVYA